MASRQMPSVIDQSRAIKEMIKQEKPSQFTIEVIKIQSFIFSRAHEQGLSIDNEKDRLMHTLSWPTIEYYHFELLDHVMHTLS